MLDPTGEHIQSYEGKTRPQVKNNEISIPTRARGVKALLLISGCAIALLLALHIRNDMGVPNASFERVSIKEISPLTTVSVNASATGQSQIQHSHASLMDRYPDLYAAVQEHFYSLSVLDSSSRKKLREVKKILSFGSATGQEAATLATMYFPGDEFVIYGVDLHQPSINAAQALVGGMPEIGEGKVHFFNGVEHAIAEFGPYDAILANSVLCFYEKKNMKAAKIVELFPFQAFQEALEYLDSSLKVGGVLGMTNTNYYFARSEIHQRYRSFARCINFVPIVDDKTSTIKKEREVMDGTLLWFRDCAWVKEKN